MEKDKRRKDPGITAGINKAGNEKRCAACNPPPALSVAYATTNTKRDATSDAKENRMQKQKTRMLYHVQGFYFGKWETVTIDDNMEDARQSLNDYRDNVTRYDGTRFRIQKERELLPSCKPTNTTADAQGVSCRLQEAVV